MSRFANLSARRRRLNGALPSSALVIAGVAGILALAVIGWLLRLQWPDTPSTIEPGHLPVTVGGTLFNIPSDAIRVGIQRRSGAQDRIDLVFLYPSLAPPGPPPHVTAETVEALPMTPDRIFLTIAAHGGAMSPDERMRTIYPLYLDQNVIETNAGLLMQPFRETSPYRDEDLFIAPRSDFVARCTRDGATPGTCLSERRIGGADLTFRFPRSWLGQWRDVAEAMARLTAMHRPG